MFWPPPPICERISKLWAMAYGSQSTGESANALAPLRRIQHEFDLSDVELAFIAEYTAKDPGKSRERPFNVLELIIALLSERHIVLTLDKALASALWTLHTHVCRQYLHTPRLIIRSTEPESGKTLLLAFMDQLVCDPLRTSNTSDAVIYYQLDEFPQTTFLIDETEFFQMSETFIEMFDAGHRQGGYIHRTVAVKGGGRKVVPFGVFGPIALAGVEGRYYPPQMLTRSISFYMQKEAEGRDELWPDDPHLTTARNYIIAWAASFQRPQHCEIPALGRAENNYQPLIEIGESLGYGATARAMARALYRPFDDPVVQVLADIRRIFDGPPRIDTIWSPELLEALHALEDASWDEFRGVKGDQAPHKLRKAELYDLLRPKGLRSRTVSKMVGGKRKSHKGFYRTDLEPVWHRLFGAGAPAQGNKIISLPRRSERRSGDADE